MITDHNFTFIPNCNFWWCNYRDHSITFSSLKDSILKIYLFYILTL